ncbi:MAG: hypothetical protein Roseis2KO_53700 [Roseivirga sp.]
MTTVKSVRIYKDIEELVNSQGLNFSQLVNESLQDRIKQSVWVPNFKIHEHAGISPQELVNRISNVKFLRYKSQAVKFSLMASNSYKMSVNQNIHSYVNGDFNKIHDSYVYFNIEFPTDLYLFLKTHTWEQVEQFLYTYLACQLFIGTDKHKQEIEECIEHQILRKAVTLYSDDFSDVRSVFKKFEEGAEDYQTLNKLSDTYLDLLCSLNVSPLMFPYMKTWLWPILTPFSLKQALPKRKVIEGEIRMAAGFMKNIYDSNDDWQSIVVNGTNKNDDLNRVGSSEIALKSWKAKYHHYYLSDFLYE